MKRMKFFYILGNFSEAFVTNFQWSWKIKKLLFFWSYPPSSRVKHLNEGSFFRLCAILFKWKSLSWSASGTLEMNEKSKIVWANYKSNSIVILLIDFIFFMISLISQNLVSAIVRSLFINYSINTQGLLPFCEIYFQVCYHFLILSFKLSYHNAYRL